MVKQQAERSSGAIWRAVRWGFALFVVLAVVGIAGASWWLRASLPQLDGNATASGLRAAATITRDAQGSVTIRAVNRPDLAYATGYAHAQDRFFQMDLLRRVAAGELSELVGAAALPTDTRNRIHRFRARAQAQLASLPAEQLDLMQRYANGANAGLQAMGAYPPEYGMMRVTPRAWSPADTLLVIDAMYFDLQGSEVRRALARDALRESVGPDMLAFLTPRSSHWDVPLDGERPPVAPLVIPDKRPDWLDKPASAKVSMGSPEDDSSFVGSNAWAVDAKHAKDGHAMVANDMHLGLSLPNTWYRLTLEFPDTVGGVRRISGVSLPGAPVVVAGSNGDVAWGFTNSYGHFIDLVALEIDPDKPARYRGPDGTWAQAVEHPESIAVRGGREERMVVRETPWGPMMRSGKKTFAIRWVAHLPGSADLTLQRMEMVRSLPQALTVAQNSGVPTQNIVVADKNGRIGWTLAGPLPVGMLDPDGFPVTPAQAAAGASLQRARDTAYPEIVDPASGRLWTGNSRQLSDPVWQARIGDGGADMGARSTQIRNGLYAKDRFDEQDLLAIQLDHRAVWIAYWRQLAIKALNEGALAGHPQRAEFKRLVNAWDGTAGVDAVGYTLVKAFYQSLYMAWFGGLDARLSAIAPGVSMRTASLRLEPVMQALAEERAWVPPHTKDWESFMLDRIDTVIAKYTASGRLLADARWGDRNRLAIAHPFARLMPPPMAAWLSAPRQAVPGDIHMPRVQSPTKGASERFVVAPGRESQAIMEMPGGASGHFMSPFFLAGHEDWVRGKPSAFLPGGQAHLLELMP